MTPEQALAAFRDATGLSVAVVHDPVSDALWWAEPDRPDVFVCTVGDRTLHIDELAPKGDT